MDLTRRNLAAVLLFAAIALTALQGLGLAPGVAGAGTEIVAKHVVGAIPVADPSSGMWREATPLEVPLSGQMTAEPMKMDPSTPSLEIRALYNATHIAFRVDWQDETKDNRTINVTDFRDALAIQMAPPTPLPNVCMGSAGARLHIMQWKADWQADIEEGFKDLQDAFPNFWSDWYPYAMGEPPYTVPDDFAGNASLYLVGYTVGNPFSQPLKVTSVEDAVAEGFFTITTQVSQDAIGRGVWEGRNWSVVVARPLVSSDSADVRVAHGNVMAFAVWDGASGDVGARKSVSTWVTLSLGPGAHSPDVVALAGGTAAVLATAGVIAIIVLRRRGKAGRKPGAPGGP